MLFKIQMFAITAIALLAAACSNSDSDLKKSFEVQVEGTIEREDAILELQTYNGANVIAYRTCMEITTKMASDASDIPCTRLTADAPMIMILESDFLAKLAKDMGIDFVEYKALASKTMNERAAKLAEVEHALATEQVLDGRRLKELTGDVDVLRYFRNGLRPNATASHDIYDSAARNFWYAPSLTDTYGSFVDTCRKYNYIPAKRADLDEIIDWLGADDFLIEINDGKPVYGHSKFWERLKGSKVPEKYKKEPSRHADFGLWTQDVIKHKRSQEMVTFSAVSIVGDVVGSPFDVASTINAPIDAGQAIQRNPSTWSYYTDAKMAGLCYRPNKRFKVGISFETGSQNPLTVLATQFDSPARRAGILKGDVIVEVAETNISTVKEYLSLTEKWDKRSPLLVKVKRGNQFVDIRVEGNE